MAEMTPQEAIKNIDDILDSPYLFDESIDYQLTTDDIECLEMAKEALEKQIPKKPTKNNPICYEKTKDGIEHFAYDYFCPDCNKQIKATEHHCHCGQALDWSDTE